MTERTLELHGALTALVTPFGPDSAVDLPALERFARWQIEMGIDGLVPCGTTGEGATLTDSEHGAVIATVVRAAEGRVPVVAGCGSNDTRRCCAAAKRAAEAGADALLVVTPYYNKPNRTGMLSHFQAVAAATSLPIVLYNVPGRTGQNLGAEWILELAGIPRIVAVKEASGDLDQISEILAGRPAGFAVLSGDDSLALPTVALGGEGIVSVVSNEAPGEMAELIAAAREGDLERARSLHFRLLPLMTANFAESNPVPVKTALAMLGHCEAHLRPPLGPASEQTHELLRSCLGRCGIPEPYR
jgi:4-hydroxy-tetrahydrodipicolinate synthase